MKRILSILSIITLLFSLTACGSTPTLDSSYSGAVEFSDAHLNCTADLTADGNTMTLSLTSPENLSGLCYEYRSGELHTTLNGLDCVTPAESLSPTAVPTLLYELFSRCDEAKYQGTEDNADVFILSTSAGDMTVTAVDGAPESLTFGNITVSFN